MKMRSVFLLGGACVAAGSALAQQKIDPSGGKASYVPRPQSLALPASYQGPQMLVSPLPPGSGTPTTTTFSSSVVVPINDFTTSSDTIVVSAVGTYLFDVDVTTNITHTWINDIETVVFAPGGKRVTLTAYSGGANDDCFNGTIWDDTSINASSTYVYTSGITAPDLAPCGSFSSLIGQNPNGTWTIQFYDNAGADVGANSGWTLKITTLSSGTSQTPSSPTTFTRTGLALAINDFSTVADSLTASGLGTNIAEVRVTTAITHTYAADLDVRLLSPAGTEVTLTNLNGGGTDDAFNGTLWFDDSRTGLLDNAAGNYAYTANVPQLTPDGNFTSLWGQNPNGLWTLSVYDNAGIDQGIFDGWSLTVRTWGAGTPTPYCTAGTTTNGCLASISATNNPSLTQAQSCIVNVTNVEGAKSALMFYGITGAQAVPWGAGNNSLLCVKPPTQRSQGLNTGGTVNTCNGALAWNWDAFQAANPGAVGNPWTLGEKAWVQAWFRDPTAVKTTNLSNGVELTYQP